MKRMKRVTGRETLRDEHRRLGRDVSTVSVACGDDADETANQA